MFMTSDHLLSTHIWRVVRPSRKSKSRLILPISPWSTAHVFGGIVFIYMLIVTWFTTPPLVNIVACPFPSIYVGHASGKLHATYRHVFNLSLTHIHLRMCRSEFVNIIVATKSKWVLVRDEREEVLSNQLFVHGGWFGGRKERQTNKTHGKGLYVTIPTTRINVISYC